MSIQGLHEDDLTAAPTHGFGSAKRRETSDTRQAAEQPAKTRWGNTLTGGALRRGGMAQLLMARYKHLVENNPGMLSGANFQITIMPSVGGCVIDGGITAIAYSAESQVALAMSLLTLSSLPPGTRSELQVTGVPSPLDRYTNWTWRATTHHYYGATVRAGVAAEVAEHLSAVTGAQFIAQQVSLLNPMVLGQNVSSQDLLGIDNAMMQTVQTLMQEWRCNFEGMAPARWDEISAAVQAAGGRIYMKMTRAAGGVVEADGTILRRDWEILVYSKENSAQNRDAVEIGPDRSGGPIAVIGGYFNPFAIAPNPKTPTKTWGLSIHITSVQVGDGTGDHTAAQRVSLAALAVSEITRDPAVLASAMLQMADPTTHDMGSLNLVSGYGVGLSDRNATDFSADESPKYPPLNLAGINEGPGGYDAAVTYLKNILEEGMVIASLDFPTTGPGARGTTLLSSVAVDTEAEAALLQQIDALFPEGMLANALTAMKVVDPVVVQFQDGKPMMFLSPGGSVVIEGVPMSLQVADQLAVLTMETRRGTSQFANKVAYLGDVGNEPGRSHVMEAVLIEMSGVSPVFTTSIMSVVLDPSLVQAVGTLTRKMLGVAAPCELVFSIARGRMEFNHGFHAARGLSMSQGSGVRGLGGASSLGNLRGGTGLRGRMV